MMLDDQIHAEVVKLSKEGDELAEVGKYLQAIEKYGEALELLPKPLEDWEASTWLVGTIGNAYFLNRNYPEAYSKMRECLKYPRAVGNPFVHLRLGQACYELEKFDCAKDNLMRAYMGADEEIFSHDHPKYWQYIREFI